MQGDVKHSSAKEHCNFRFKFLISQGHLKSCRDVVRLDAREKSKLEAPYCHSESQSNVAAETFKRLGTFKILMRCKELQGTSWNVRRCPDVSGRRVLLHRMAGS